MSRDNTFLGYPVTYKFIIVILGLATFVHSGLMNGSMNVIVSSLQKEFYLSSQETGYYLSSYDVGSVIGSLVIPLVSTRFGSKPRWIAFGLFTLFIGSIITCIPHFLRDSDLSMSGDVSIEICNRTVSQFEPNKTLETSQLVVAILPPKYYLGFIQLRHFLYIANLIMGLGSASMIALVFSYIEDVAPHDKSATLESVYYVCGALGMGVFFALTSYCLTYFTDFNSLANELPDWLTTNHPNWIGAWWLPFATMSFVGLFFGFVIFMLPVKLTKETHLNETEMLDLTNENRTSKQKKTERVRTRSGNYSNKIYRSINSIYGSKISINNLSTHHVDSLFTKTVSLLKNPIYLLILLAGIIEGLLQNSVLAFASLFFEYQYRFSTGKASLIIGLLALPPLLIGGLISGQICDRFKNKLEPCLKFLTGMLVLNVLFYAGFMIYCPQSTLISTSTSVDLSIGKFQGTQLQGYNSTSEQQNCFQTSPNCNCDPKIFKPVCLNGANDIYFQSPCLAGCSSFEKTVKKDYFSQCSQNNCDAYFTGSGLNKEDSTFVDGVCPKSAVCTSRLILSCICLFMLMLLNALIFIPYMKCLIAVAQPKNTDQESDEAKEMNTVVLSLKQFFMNLFGTIPGPIIFGTVIDSSCKYWHTDSQDQRTCKLYDNEKFAFSFGVMGMGFKLTCLICVVVSLIIAVKARNH